MARAPKQRRLHHIQRPESRKFKGWVVQITRGGVATVRRFSDTRWGGREGALRAALRERDRLLRALPPPVLVKVRGTRNTTGVIGVQLVRRLSRRGRVLRAYVATFIWPPRSRHQHQKTFSVQKHGVRRARELAIAERRAALARTAQYERRCLQERERRERARGTEARADAYSLAQ